MFIILFPFRCSVAAILQDIFGTKIMKIQNKRVILAITTTILLCFPVILAHNVSNKAASLHEDHDHGGHEHQHDHGEHHEHGGGHHEGEEHGSHEKNELVSHSVEK